MTTAVDAVDDVLLGVAKDLYRETHDDRGECVDQERWAALTSTFPEVAAQAVPKREAGTGSDEKRLAPGEFWRAVDKERLYRAPYRPRRKPSSEMTMADGSPLRGLVEGIDLVDVDGDPWPGFVRDERLVDDLGFDDDEHDSATTTLGGFHVEKGSQKDRSHGHLLEHCVLCGHLLPLKWPDAVCEFPEAPTLAGQFCNCNGCLRSPQRGRGRPRYCSQECAREMDNAMDRARLRSTGSKSRKFHPDADRIAQHKISMRDGARGRLDPMVTTFDLSAVRVSGAPALRMTTPQQWNAMPRRRCEAAEVALRHLEGMCVGEHIDNWLVVVGQTA